MDSKIFFLPAIMLAVVGLHGWWFLRITDFGIILLMTAIIYFGAAWWLDNSRRDWWSFAILPTLLSWSVLSYGLIVSTSLLRVLVIVLSVFMSIIYWRLVYLYVVRHTSYKPFSLERLAPYLSFVTVFFAAAAAYGLRIFLDVPGIQLWVILIIFQLGIVHQWLWSHKVSWKSAWRYAAAFILVITELFFIFDFLPFDYNVLGFMLASVWYAISGLAANFIAGRLTGNKTKLIIFLLLVTWIIVLVTARWF